MHRCRPSLALLVLSPIGAELLAAYNDTTGRPLALLGNLVFFAALYGCPALLIRELARRTGARLARDPAAQRRRGAAAGGRDRPVAVQRVLRRRARLGGVGARDLRRAARAERVHGAELHPRPRHLQLRRADRAGRGAAPAIAHEPWLRRRGIVVAALLWLAVAALLVADTSEPRATAAELAVTLAVVAALVAAALRTGRRRATSDSRPHRAVTAPLRPRASPRAAPRVRTALAASFLLTAAYSMAPETWAGIAFALAVAALGARACSRAGAGRSSTSPRSPPARCWPAARSPSRTTRWSARPRRRRSTPTTWSMLAVVAAAGAYSCAAARRRPLPA